MTETRQILERLGYAYFEADFNGRLCAANQAFCTLVGVNPDQILGENLLELFGANQVPEFIDALDTIRDGSLPASEIELEYKNRAGKTLLLEFSIAASPNQNGDPLDLNGIVREISSRRQVQKSLEAAEHELQIGRRIQASFLPSEIPEIPGWEIETHFEAAREVAGDFYDVFTLSSGRRIGFVMADVVDKGVGAALFMALFRSLIRAFVDQHYKLGWMDVLSGDLSSTPESASVSRRRKMLSTGTTALKNAIDLTNNFIAKNHGDSNMFATMFVGVLDPTSGSLVYINGGHDPPILYRHSGEVERLAPTGPAVGMLPDMSFNIESILLKQGDTLVAFTDGVNDALDPSGEPFSEDRLLPLVTKPAQHASQIRDRIVDGLHNHICERSQYDDITFFVLKRLEV